MQHRPVERIGRFQDPFVRQIKKLSIFESFDLCGEFQQVFCSSISLLKKAGFSVSEFDYSILALIVFFKEV